MMKKTILRSQELTCPSCVTKIEKALKSVPGVTDAKVFFSTGRIEVHHDPEKTGEDKLIEAIRSVGYDSRVSPF